MRDTQKQPASVPAELVEQWYDEYDTHIMQLCDDQIRFAQYVADKAAAYGREQSHNDIRISADQWAELVARHPETMQVLFGGQA